MDPMRSAIASRDAVCRRGDGASANRSRTTSDFDSLRRRDSASIWATSASGNRTVKVFIAVMYYAIVTNAIHPKSAFGVLPLVHPGLAEDNRGRKTGDRIVSQGQSTANRMLPTDRIAYSAITERPPLKLPGGARMAVWVIVNVEEWDPKDTMPRTVLTPPAGGAPSPDIPNWCWHEYGNRVGFWRFVKVFDEFQIPGVLAINGCAIEAFPPIVKAALERKWEFIGHGFTQRNMQKVPDEKADIQMTTKAITKATGKKPRGWLGPGLTETWETPDLLKEDGYDYVADWVLDDQPVWLKTRTKPIVNIPYTQECNDVAMMLIQHHKASEYYDRAVDQFDQIYADAEDSARVMAIVVHPYIMGAPHRLKYFRNVFAHIKKKPDVAFMTGEQIFDWYTTVGPKAP
jgi:allantoinase